MAYKQEVVLTKWVRSYKLDDSVLIAPKLLTTVNVDGPGKYYVFEKRGRRLVDDRVTIDGNSPTIERTGKYSEATFAPEEYALNTYVKVNETDILGSPASKILQEEVRYITETRRFKKEYQMKYILDNVPNTTSSGSKWDDTGATIEKDIREAIEKFDEQAGTLPNTIIIPRKVWNVLVMDSTLSQRWTLIPGRKDQDLELKNLFGYLFDSIKNILIPFCRYESGPLGAEAEEDLWANDDVYLLFVGGDKTKDDDTGEDISVGTVKTFTWASIFQKEKETVGSWLSLNGKIKYVEVRENYDMKLVCSNAVLKVTDVLK